MDMSVAPLATGELRTRRSRHAPVLRALFKIGCGLIEGTAILSAAVASHVAWQAMPFAIPAPLEYQVRLGVAIAMLVAIVPLLRNEDRVGLYVGEATLGRTATVWNTAFILLLVVAFATRRTEEASRGAVILFYVAGLGALWCARGLIARLVRLALRYGLVVERRILVVGTDAGIAAFGGHYREHHHGYEIVGAVAIRTTLHGGRTANLVGDLHRAVEIARDMSVADVYVAVPWSEIEVIDSCVEAFLNMPVAIHLAPERILDRFDHVTIARVGPIASLELTRPASGTAIAVKWTMDVLLAAIGLVMLAPLFAGVAVAIKLGSPGPVFFRQTRYGFNQRPFRILKFRTMTSYDDGAVVPQARENDDRITALGRFLRRSNIDELPQLLNVLRGQMSLVGPRPHAVPHNHLFQSRIALYARRHNVRPGITGWAQVNGLRGETDTDEKMRRRVEYDLFYIDNWSIGLDLRIILRTVLSPKAYRNAR